MDQQVIDTLENAKENLLLAQRECAWCHLDFNTADELAQHIIDNHPKDADGIRH